MRGVILLAHGSRDPLWHQPVLAVAGQMQASAPGTPVCCAYLELSAPDLPSATAQFVASGLTAIRVVPLFLGTGKHAREDLPKLVQDLRTRYPGIAFELTPPVGEDARLTALLARIALDG